MKLIGAEKTGTKNKGEKVGWRGGGGEEGQ
jgi:hypothetical protein